MRGSFHTTGPAFGNAAGCSGRIAELFEAGVGHPLEIGVGRAIPRASQPLEQVVAMEGEGPTLEVVRIVFRWFPPVRLDGWRKSEMSESAGHRRGATAVHAHHEHPRPDRHGLDWKGRWAAHGLSLEGLVRTSISAAGHRRAGKRQLGQASCR